jgi:hypothetical protein
MGNVKKVIITMCVVLMVVGMCVSCSYSQDKPSEDDMKSILLSLVVSYYRGHPNAFSNIKYDIFQITHSFFKNGSDGRDRYCVEITYDISYVSKMSGKQTNEKTTGKVEKFSFMKKGDDWYGKQGWDIQ